MMSQPNPAGAGGFGGSPSMMNPQPLAGSNASPTPNPGEDPSCAAISQQAENQRKPADIIVAVDGSGSMDDEIGFVREQLNAFSEQIVKSGIDVRIILIGGSFIPRDEDIDEEVEESVDADDNGICVAAPLGSGACPLDSKAPAYFHVSKEVGSHDALELIVDEFPQYQSQLRANASKTFVVVTDDDANDSAVEFTQSVASLPGGLFSSWTFSGIYGLSDCPDSESIGTVYNELVKQTQGVAGDLCEQDFAPVFDALAKAVITGSGLDCAWSIPAAPAGKTFDRKQVNVQYTTQGAAPRSLLQVSDEAACGARSGWYYDAPSDPKRILACPTTCGELQRDQQTKFDVLFGCETLTAPD